MCTSRHPYVHPGTAAVNLTACNFPIKGRAFTIALHSKMTSSRFLLESNQLTLLQAGVLPQSLQSLDGIPNAFRYDLTALASERIPNHMSTSRCVMMTLHLGRDDRGKENAVSSPFRTVSRFKLEIGTSLLVWSA